ncbi:hypothetical protein GWK47_005865 [Chionoecetes opilio]|uniref:Uncharacterized protein n=1 Tax=Chionoecetes opilio TaxID=41210 RepID=A0A8J4Y7R1_CHIOP|nr:hypothetical protein GWK47_005865 [Chionoecetes opilio]
MGNLLAVVALLQNTKLRQSPSTAFMVNLPACLLPVCALGMPLLGLGCLLQELYGRILIPEKVILAFFSLGFTLSQVHIHTICALALNSPCPQPPRRKPHSVSVSSSPHQGFSFPAFRVPRQKGFPHTNFDAVAALEKTFPDLKVRNLVGTDLSSVLVPLDEESFLLLEDTALDLDAPAKLIKLDP